MSKHTPGPWTYDADDGSLTPAPGSGRNLVGRFRCGRDDAGQDARPTKADARLITAAPELLEACKLAYERFRHGGEMDMALLQSAIAKAEGGYSSL